MRFVPSLCRDSGLRPASRARPRRPCQMQLLWEPYSVEAPHYASGAVRGPLSNVVVSDFLGPTELRSALRAFALKAKFSPTANSLED